MGGGNPILYARDDFSNQDNLDAVQAAVCYERQPTDRHGVDRHIPMRDSWSDRESITAG